MNISKLKNYLFLLSRKYFNNNIQPSYIEPILGKLFLFDLKIPGIDTNDIQCLNIELISFTLFMFHFERSGKYAKDEQP